MVDRMKMFLDKQNRKQEEDLQNSQILRTKTMAFKEVIGNIMIKIHKHENTFRIRIFVGTDTNGKKIMKSTTFIPPVDATPKKVIRL